VATGSLVGLCDDNGNGNHHNGEKNDNNNKGQDSMDVNDNKVQWHQTIISQVATVGTKDGYTKEVPLPKVPRLLQSTRRIEDKPLYSLPGNLFQQAIPTYDRVHSIASVLNRNITRPWA
jgi:hypothetical protein